MNIKIKKHYLSFVIVVAAVFVAPLSALAQSSGVSKPIEIFKEENASPFVETALTQALDSGQIQGQKFFDKASMKAFYHARNYDSVWLQTSFFNSSTKGDKILKALENSWRHGLNPNSYHINEIRELMETSQGGDDYTLDLVLSDALARYGRDLTGMRINPRSIGQRSKYWRQPLNTVDILDHVANATNAESALAELEPKGNLYKKLQAELETLYKVTASEGTPPPISIRGILRPGTNRNAVLAIRERMGFSPDSGFQGPTYYDDELAQAVMAFQKSHGLEPDGVVGPHTIKIMNMTHEDSINQILVNLERLRWMKPDKPERYVMVNVPSATLWAIENNQVSLEMPVVVGRKKRPTNIFSTEITGIRFNPRWTVPPTIKRDDYLPKLREDPYYLTDRGIELVDRDNMTVDPGLVDWNEASWSDVNAMRMVQGSGNRNPLGLVRVIMQNPYNIYLHDTPTKSYFKRTNRALSSGCVRMSEPQKLADFVLSTNEGWTDKSKERILAKGKQIDIRADNPIPVYIIYQTVWLGDNGQIVYGNDLYGRDAKLLKELKNIDGVAEPVNNEQVLASKSAINS